MDKPTGLQGTYDGTCIACYTATDTALGVEGDLDQQAAFLVALGVPMAEAIATVEKYEPPRRSLYTVCATCAAKAGLPEPKLAIVGDSIPTVSIPTIE